MPYNMSISSATYDHVNYFMAVLKSIGFLSLEITFVLHVYRDKPKGFPLALVIMNVFMYVLYRFISY